MHVFKFEICLSYELTSGFLPVHSFSSPVRVGAWKDGSIKMFKSSKCSIQEFVVCNIQNLNIHSFKNCTETTSNAEFREKWQAEISEENEENDRTVEEQN